MQTKKRGNCTRCKGTGKETAIFGGAMVQKPCPICKGTGNKPTKQ